MEKRKNKLKVKQFNKKEPLGVKILAIIIFINSFLIVGISLISLYNQLNFVNWIVIILSLILTFVIGIGLFLIGLGLKKGNVIARNLAVIILIFSFLQKFSDIIKLESFLWMEVLQFVGILLLNGALIVYLFSDDDAKKFFKK